MSKLSRYKDVGWYAASGLLFYLLLGFSSILPGGAVKAADVRLLVPAYAYPTGNSTMWPSLIQAAGTLKEGIGVILNPNSGPGAQVDANYSHVVTDFRNAGGRVYGYVPTTYGQRNLNDVKQDVERYYNFYPGLVDGIFFDEMANDLSRTGYYQQLHNHVKSHPGDALVIGNPGTSYLNDASQGASGYTPADYAASADVLVAFEDDEAAYRNDDRAPDWNPGGPEHVGHIVHTTGGQWDGNLLQLALDRGAGWVYFTNDVEPNPYDQIPPYWEQEVAAVASARGTPVPLPAAFPLFLTGFGLLTGLKRLFRGKVRGDG